jgi:Cu/Ag efflux pump CusA
MIFSTALTLFVVPAMYTYLARKKTAAPLESPPPA